MENVNLVTHPLVQHKLTLMRDRDTPTASFRQLLREIATLITYEVTRDLKLTTKKIHTPLAEMDARLLEGMIDLVPSARVAHIGIYRDPTTLAPVEYFFKAPSDIGDRVVIVVDPMLATANSANAAITKLKERGAKDIRFVCILSAPEG